MSSGQSYEVRHPEMACLTRTCILVGIDVADDGDPGRVQDLLAASRHGDRTARRRFRFAMNKARLDASPGGPFASVRGPKAAQLTQIGPSTSRPYFFIFL